jgi:hypothetical protein
VARSYRVFVFIALFLVLAPASALAVGRVKVTGRCVGDTVSGRVTVRARAGARFTVRLLQQRTAGSSWARTNRARRFKSRGHRGSYGVRFDVSSFDAYAYRLGVYRGRRRTLSRPIPAASCAPGAQVPEAPLALVLPLSLLGTGSLLLLRARAAR